MSKKVFDTKWIQVFETRHGFYYAQRKGKDSVAILGFKKTAEEYQFLIRYQPLPPIDQVEHLFPCCITGTIEPQTDLLTCVRHELYEEGGYQLKADTDIIATTSFIGSTQMSETTHVYLIDLTNYNQNEIINDGSYLETLAVTKWISQKTLESILALETTLVSLHIAYHLFKCSLCK